MNDVDPHRDFDSVSYNHWKTAVESELQGVPFERKLVSRTPEGIDLQPVYTAQDLQGLEGLESFPGFAPFLRGGRASGFTKQTWDISQEIDFTHPTEFNDAARSSIRNGLTALNIVLDNATRNGYDPDWSPATDVGRGGLSIATLEDLDRALSGIDLGTISLFIRSGASALPVSALLIALARRRKIDPSALRGCIEMDPIGVLAHEGILCQSLESAYQEMTLLTRWAKTHAPSLQTICVHTRAWHESGGSAVHELAYGLASAVEYIRALIAQGLTVDDVAPRMRLALTVGDQFFMEVAKMRAMRLLWARVIEVFQGSVKSQNVHIHARTSQRNKTIYDAHNNILRSTVESFAAVVGGCDSLQVGAFDSVYRTPDEFSRRIARNTQLILAQECGLTSFIDPAGGSWYVEKLTDQLARSAWTLFQQVESRGGMAAAMKSGIVQDEIERVQKAQEKAMTERKITLVGTTHYANPQEVAPVTPPVDVMGFHQKRKKQISQYRTQWDNADHHGVLTSLSRIVESQPHEVMEAAIESVQKGATLGEMTRAIRIHDQPTVAIRPVRLERLSSPFEQLRKSVEEYATATGSPVTAFLCTMGPPAQHRARADFSKSFLEAAGMRTLYPQGFNTPEEAVQAAQASKASIVVLCSTDETYPTLVPQLIPAIKQSMPGTQILLAGYPAEHIEAFCKAGIDDFIHLRANAWQVLTHIFEKCRGAYVQNA